MARTSAKHSADYVQQEEITLTQREEVRKNGLVSLSFYNLFWIFVTCSVGGLIVETLVSYPVDGVWKNRAGFIWGPFSPIYGVGGVLVTVMLNRMAAEHPVKIFMFSAFLGGAFEYLAGWFFENFFGIVAWSYQDKLFNIGGHTCLEVMILWGFIGLLWVKCLLPFVVKCFGVVPERVQTPLTAVCFAYILLNAGMTLTAFDCWYLRSAGMAPQNAIQLFFAENYGDEFMADRFETMSLFAGLAGR